MSYSLSIDIPAQQAGLTWSAQLIDNTGANVGSAITSGFSGNYDYLWSYAAVPDSFTQGQIVFTASNGMEFISPITPASGNFAANTSGTLNDSATWDGYTIGQVVKALRNMGALA